MSVKLNGRIDMQEDISINEFEAMMTTRVHCELLKNKGIAKESYNRNEIALKYAIAANKIFEDFGFKNNNFAGFGMGNLHRWRLPWRQSS